MGRWFAHGWTDAGRVSNVISKFRSAGGAGKPIHLKVDVSFATIDADALAAAHREWRPSALPPAVLADLTEPIQFQAAAEGISLEEMAKVVIASTSSRQFIARLRPLVDLGIEAINLHNVGTNQAEFIEIFGRDVLPLLRSTPAIERPLFA
jgi:coenzyme F420-dependent glucose-6-phosphate dehydrogenase